VSAPRMKFTTVTSPLLRGYSGDNAETLLYSLRVPSKVVVDPRLAH